VYTTHKSPSHYFSVWSSCLPFPEYLTTLQRRALSPHADKHVMLFHHRRIEKLLFRLGLHWRTTMVSSALDYYSELLHSNVQTSNTWATYLRTNMINDWLFLQECGVHMHTPSSSSSSSSSPPPPLSSPDNCSLDDPQEIRNPVLPQKDVQDQSFGVLTPLSPYPVQATSRFAGHFACPDSHAVDANGNEQMYTISFPRYRNFLKYLETTRGTLQYTNPLQQCLDAAHAMFGFLLTYGIKARVCMKTLVKLFEDVPQWVRKLRDIRMRVQRRYKFCSQFEYWLSCACEHLSDKDHITNTWRSNLIRHPVSAILTQVIQNARNEHCKRSIRHTPTQWNQWKQGLDDLLERVHEYETIKDVTDDIRHLARTVGLVPNDVQRIERNCDDKYIRQQSKYLKRLYNMAIEYYLWQHPAESLTHSLPVCPHWLYDNKKRLHEAVTDEVRAVDNVCNVWIGYLRDCRLQWVVATVVYAHLTTHHPCTQDLHGSLEDNLVFFDADFVRSVVFGRSSRSVCTSLLPYPRHWEIHSKSSYPPVTSSQCFEEETEIERDLNVQLSRSRVQGRIVLSSSKDSLARHTGTRFPPVFETNESFLLRLCALLRVVFSLIRHGKWTSVYELQAAIDQVVQNVISDKKWCIALYMVFLRSMLVWMFWMHGHFLKDPKTYFSPTMESILQRIARSERRDETSWFIDPTHWTHAVSDWAKRICDRAPHSSPSDPVWTNWYRLSCILLCYQTQLHALYTDRTMQPQLHRCLQCGLYTDENETTRKLVEYIVDEYHSTHDTASNVKRETPSSFCMAPLSHSTGTTRKRPLQTLSTQDTLHSFLVRMWHGLITFGCILHEQTQQDANNNKASHDNSFETPLDKLFPWFHEVFEKGNTRALPSQKKKQCR
jgi:hypothetical protein